MTFPSHVPTWVNKIYVAIGVACALLGLPLALAGEPVDIVFVIVGAWFAYKNWSILAASKRVVREHGSIDNLKAKIAELEGRRGRF